jgi:hypothetical protein
LDKDIILKRCETIAVEPENQTKNNDNDPNQAIAVSKVLTSTDLSIIHSHSSFKTVAILLYA